MTKAPRSANAAAAMETMTDVKAAGTAALLSATIRDAATVDDDVAMMMIVR